LVVQLREMLLQMVQLRGMLLQMVQLRGMLLQMVPSALHRRLRLRYCADYACGHACDSPAKRTA
jgi:hypothetical protein